MISVGVVRILLVRYLSRLQKGTMSTQAVFERAVKHHLPKAFITHLERIDEFNLGQVLTYHSKPHWWWPKSKELDYTGMPLESLLTEGELKSQYKLETKKDELFSATSDQSNKTVDLDLDLDADVSHKNK